MATGVISGLQKEGKPMAEIPRGPSPAGLVSREQSIIGSSNSFTWMLCMWERDFKVTDFDELENLGMVETLWKWEDIDSGVI